MRLFTFFLLTCGEVNEPGAQAKGRAYGGGSRGPASVGASRGPPSEPDAVEIKLLPTAVAGVDTDAALQVIADSRWVLHKEESSAELPFERVKPGKVSGQVQLVNLDKEPIDIDKNVEFWCKLTPEFKNTGLVFKSSPKRLQYTDERQQQCYDALMNNTKQYQCCSILLTGDQMKHLNDKRLLNKVLQAHDGGNEQQWVFSLEDTFWVYARYVGSEFLTKLWSWGGNDDKPTFQFQAKLESAQVQSRQNGEDGEDGKAGYDVHAKSPTHVKDKGVSRSWKYAENPDSSAMFPLVGKETQVFVFKFVVEVDDEEATCRSFDGCSICTDDRREFMMAGCQHWVCKSCYESIAPSGIFKCPFCRTLTNTADVVEISDVPETQNAL
jgi:hypothetical protein